MKEKGKKIEYRWTADSLLANIQSFGKKPGAKAAPEDPAIIAYIKELKQQIAEEKRKKQKSKSNT